MDLINEIQANARKDVHTKQELFLKLCSLNYLNALVKLEEYKKHISYGTIKPTVIWLVKYLVNNNLTGLCDDIAVNLEDDCLFIRCYGLQFSFHHINSKMLTEEWPQLLNADIMWDGVRLQPVAKQLYELAKEADSQESAEEMVRERVKMITQGN